MIVFFTSYGFFSQITFISKTCKQSILNIKAKQISIKQYEEIAAITLKVKKNLN